MNKMIKFFKEGVNSYMRNMSDYQLFRITGDCTPMYDNEDWYLPEREVKPAIVKLSGLFKRNCFRCWI